MFEPFDLFKLEIFLAFQNIVECKDYKLNVFQRRSYNAQQTRLMLDHRPWHWPNN